MAAEGPPNPYKVLGLQFGADDAAIKDAYRKLARKWHPDRNRGNDKASDIFERIARANEQLTDPEAKAKVDAVFIAEAERKARRSKREKDMDSQRVSFKRKLEEAEASERAGAAARRRASTDEEALRREGRARREQTAERRGRADAQMSAAAKAAVEATRTRTLKVRWSARKESHSDDSLVAVFRPFGEIEAVAMGDKGNSAKLTFVDASSVDALLNHPELSVRFKLSAGDRRAGAGVEAASQAPPPPARVDFESVAVAQMRRAQERARLLRKMEGGESSGGEGGDGDVAMADAEAESESEDGGGESDDGGDLPKGQASTSPTSFSEFEEQVLAAMRGL